MSVNPQDYDRAERRAASWWSSRHRNPEGGSPLKRIRRLTLIDLLLLIVMMGVLIPWFLQMDRSVDAGPYKVILKERLHSGNRVLTLKISLPRGADPGGDGELAGWSIFDSEELLVHEDYDLSPLPGSYREFLYTVNSGESFLCRITAGSETLEIQIEGGG